MSETARPPFKSRSQAGQDKFAFQILEEPESGTFVDIGCAHPVTLNNTKALEEQGWRGLLVDQADQRPLFAEHRSQLSRFVQADATQADFEELFASTRLPPVIDYLSLDVDEATVATLKRLPLSTYRFRVITIEHDSYRFGPGPRDTMRSLLAENGYTLVCRDVKDKGFIFEDWWVDSKFVNKDLFEGMFCDSTEGGEIMVPPPTSPFFRCYFDRIFCINLDRRPDRLRKAQEQCARWKIEGVERFQAYDGVLEEGRVNGNAGCVASHRALLEVVAFNKWERVLVLEDDFKIVHREFHKLFNDAIDEVPDDWDMLYLGGHYYDPPQFRISPRVIRFNRMKTTSSYAITWKFARKIAPYISGKGPIDELYSGFTPFHNCYILQPRLMVQSEGYSDLTHQHSDNSQSMLDEAHERMV